MRTTGAISARLPDSAMKLWRCAGPQRGMVVGDPGSMRRGVCGAGSGLAARVPYYLLEMPPRSVLTPDALGGAVAAADAQFVSWCEWGEIRGVGAGGSDPGMGLMTRTPSCVLYLQTSSRPVLPRGYDAHRGVVKSPAVDAGSISLGGGGSGPKQRRLHFWVSAWSFFWPCLMGHGGLCASAGHQDPLYRAAIGNPRRPQSLRCTCATSLLQVVSSGSWGRRRCGSLRPRVCAVKSCRWLQQDLGSGDLCRQVGGLAQRVGSDLKRR